MSDAAPLPPESRTTRLTPAGRSAVAAVLVLGLALAWSGSGLARATTAACAALVTVSLVLAWSQSRRLTASTPEPVTVPAGTAFPVEIRLTNASPWFAARDLIVAFDTPERPASRPAGWAPACEPRGHRVVAARHGPLARGRMSELRFSVATTFPLGLAEARAHFRVPAEVLVLPRLGHLPRLDEIVGPSAGADAPSPRDPRGEEEMAGLRDWREGDSLRRVHWKLSARRGRRVLREFRSGGRAAVHLVLWAQAHVPNRPGARSPAFERAVSLTATLAERLLRLGHPVRLTILGRTAVRLAPRRGRTGLGPMLRALAEIEATADAPAAHAEPRRGERVVLVTGLGRSAPPGPGAPRLRSAPPIELPGARWYEADDPAVRRLFRKLRGSGKAAAQRRPSP